MSPADRCTCAWYKDPSRYPDADCPAHGSYAKAKAQRPKDSVKVQKIERGYK